MTELETSQRDINLIIRHVQEWLSEAKVWQIQVCHPAEDDNLWTFYLPGTEDDIQIEGPSLPFLVETNEQSNDKALKATTVEEAAEMIVRYLTAVRDGGSRHLAGQLYWA